MADRVSGLAASGDQYRSPVQERHRATPSDTTSRPFMTSSPHRAHAIRSGGWTLLRPGALGVN